MQRIGVLNGENITYDHDISGLVRGLTSGGIIQGGNVVGGKLQPVQAVIELQRSNGQKMLSFFESDETITLPTSGDHKVYIEANQAKIDDGTGNAVNGSGIAEIKTGTSRPTKNFLKLASITNGTITDERAIIPKIQEVKQQADQLSSTVATHTGQIAELQEAGAIDHLEEVGIVGEAYDMNDTLFLQKTPTEADSIIPLNIGDVANNTRREIQRISNGQSFNSVELIVDKVGAPTTDCIIEVYEGVEVTVSTKEKYWKKTGSVLATGSIAYGSIATTKAKKTFSLNNSVQKTEGTKLIILVKQTNAIVNASNYFRIYADSTQYSEAFSDVLWNGSSYTREKLMPYCVSGGFAQGLLCKIKKEEIKTNPIFLGSGSGSTGVMRTNGYGALWSMQMPKFNGTITATGSGSNTGNRGSGYPYVGVDIGTTRKEAGLNTYMESWSATFDVDNYVYNDNDEITYFGRMGGGNSNTSYTISGTVSFSMKINIPKTGIVDKLFPRMLGDIGGSIFCTTIGLHIDGTKKQNEIFFGTTNTATTGTIVPGNFVLYAPVIIDGKIYKIPLYLD